MNRNFITATLTKSAALFAVLLLGTLPARAGETGAGETGDIQKEINQLQKNLKELQSEDAASIDAEVEGYLDSNDGFSSAQGDDPLKGLSLTGSVLVMNQNTVNLDPANRSLVSGAVFLNFDFALTENLRIFTNLQATTNGRFPSGFPLDAGGNGPPRTLAGEDDGIGVDGSVPVRPSGGVQVREAGFVHMLKMGGLTIGVEAGLIDPRERFLQNKYMQSENTQFVNNEFDDASAISWATSAAGVNGFGNPNRGSAGRNILGAHVWIPFGANEQFTVRMGWFNLEGSWFNDGQLFLEFQWSAKLGGRDMNIVATFVRDSLTAAGAGIDDNQWGISWDMAATERIGVFVRIAGNSEDVASVESSISFGAVMTGIGSRPDDQVGLAIGVLTANNNAANPNFPLPSDRETTVEVYYKYVTANGKMQITPHIMYVKDPGGGGLGWVDDTLFIFGVRIYVPF